MKRLFFTCLAAALIVPMAKAATIKTHLEKTAVREKSGLTSKVIATLPAGTSVTTGADNGAFTEITFNHAGKKLKGFVSKSSLQTPSGNISKVGTGEMKKSGYSSADVAAAVKGAQKFDAGTTGADPNASTELPEGSEDPAQAQVDRLEHLNPGDVSPSSEFVKAGQLTKPSTKKAAPKAP